MLNRNVELDAENVALARRIDLDDASQLPVISRRGVYEDGLLVAMHTHDRCQLLHAQSGVVTVSSGVGRWMVPPEHAMWIPAGVPHSVEMLGTVRMQSIYVRPETMPQSMDGLQVLGMTDLMRSLITEIAAMLDRDSGARRAELLMALLLAEIPELPEKPLGLPLPSDRRLASLCRAFVAAPSSRARIDDWAERLGMSRRSFTRLFVRETGLSLSTWRQQACLFAALPRLADGEAVTTVALDLGYDSVPAFTTMFSRMLGASPRSYFSNARS